MKNINSRGDIDLTIYGKTLKQTVIDNRKKQDIKAIKFSYMVKGYYKTKRYYLKQQLTSLYEFNTWEMREGSAGSGNEEQTAEYPEDIRNDTIRDDTLRSTMKKIETGRQYETCG